MKKTPKNYRKILRTIEGLCLAWENGPKDKPQDFIDDIYKFAHLASDCENLHIDWRKLLHERHKELKKAGLI